MIVYASVAALLLTAPLKIRHASVFCRCIAASPLHSTSLLESTPGHSSTARSFILLCWSYICRTWFPSLHASCWLKSRARNIYNHILLPVHLPSPSPKVFKNTPALLFSTTASAISIKPTRARRASYGSILTPRSSILGLPTRQSSGYKPKPQHLPG